MKRLIVQWAVADTTTVTTLMDNLYYHGHARFLPARASIQASCDRWSTFFSNTAINQLTPDKIHEFTVWLDNCGYSSVIVRTLIVGTWAFHRASRSDIARMVVAIAQQERSREPSSSSARVRKTRIQEKCRDTGIDRRSE